MPFLESIRRSIQQQQLVSPGQTVVVGVSGGADSLALMVVLHQLQHTLGIKLHVATLDHGWRGEASAADAQFVVQEAQNRNLPVTLRTLEPATKRSSLEAAGRKARYDLFADVAHEIGAAVVAVAHHIDDQAETVLMRILRGAGLRGLQGMSWRSGVPYHPELTLIRPLLGVTRAEIEAFCAAQGLAPRQDPTNNDPSFLRNRVRLAVLPYLQQINPNIRASLVRLADIAATESDFMAQQTNQIVEQNATQQGTRWHFPRGALVILHPALQRRVLLQLVQRVYTTGQIDLDYDHIVHAQRIATEGRQGAVAQFVGGVQMRVAYDDLVFEFENTPDRPVLSLDDAGRVPLTRQRPIQLTAGWVVLAPHVPDGYTSLNTLYLPDDKDTRLYIRTREVGDRIALPGMNGHTQKLKDWMINRKINRLHRDYIPLIVNETEVVAVIHAAESVVTEAYQVPRDNCKAWVISWKV